MNEVPDKDYELFYTELGTGAKIMHYRNSDGVFLPYAWLFKYWVDEEKKYNDYYYKVYLNQGHEYYGEVKPSEMEKFETNIKNRNFAIDVLLD